MECITALQDCTGNHWDNRANFVKKSGKYSLVDQAADQDSDPEELEAMEGAQPETVLERIDSTAALSPCTQKLVMTIFDAKMMSASLQSMKIDSQKMPLGKLSRKTIIKAYSVLKTMIELVKGPHTLEPQVVSIRLKAATAQLYHLVPHVITKQAISCEAELMAEVKLLDDLLALEASQRVIGVPGLRLSVQAQYSSLGIDIKPVGSLTPQASLIERYVRTTHGRTHSEYTLKISNLYELDQPSISKRFQAHSKDIPNKQLLWHGSRLGNWVGILSQGLRIAPPEAPVTGYMFGKGVYFANSVSKSANYCRHEEHKRNPMGLLLLCEVALGAPQLLTRAQTNISQPSDGFHSVKGCGKMHLPESSQEALACGVKVPLGPIQECKEFQTTLVYDEYIIYNEAQQRPRYLVELQFCPVEMVMISDSD
eukprot:TRINITY_DN5535_c0_g1_i3.p2 TRINITY_DN5535_c0_g1~~TRINITY_DN5535_c0_g1_i3.p2  ORF type:complete len:425 (+),score=95.24 TRINITY_DN5535_c0_g1_i3:1373-2647(+)